MQYYAILYSRDRTLRETLILIFHRFIVQIIRFYAIYVEEY